VSVAIASIVVAWLVAALVLFGKLTPNFDHRSRFISELARVGAPHERLVSYGVFLPIGLGILGLGLRFLMRAARLPALGDAAGLAICIAVGYIVAAFFPYQRADARGQPIAVWIHEIGGGVEYLGGAAALWLAAGKLPAPWSVAALASALIVFAATIGFQLPRFRAWRGALQRLTECVLFGALIAFAYLADQTSI